MEGLAVKLKAGWLLLMAAYCLGQTSDAWLQHHQAARQALREKRWAVAVQEARAAFDAVSKQGPGDPRYIRAQLDWADAEVQNSIVASQSRLMRAIAAAESNGTFAKEPGLEDELRRGVVTRVMTLAGRAYSAARYSEAVTDERQALVQISKLPNPDLKNVLRMVNQVGLTLARDGYYKAAETVYLRGLALADDALILGNVAEFYARQGRLAEAEAAVERAVTLDASSDAPANSESSVAFQRALRLASVNNERGQYDVAESVIQQASGGNGPLAGAAVQRALAVADCGRGKFAGAQDHFRQALALYQQGDRGESHDAAQLLLDKVRCSVRARDLTTAQQDLDAARALMQKLLRGDHPEIAFVQWRQAEIFEAQKSARDAESAMAPGLLLMQEAAGDVPVVAQMLEDLARMQKAGGHAAAAQESLARAKAIRARWVKPARPRNTGTSSIAETAEQVYWDSLQGRQDSAQFRLYLADFPKGKFVTQARSLADASAAGPCDRNFDGLSEVALATCIEKRKILGEAPATLVAYVENDAILFAGTFERTAPRAVSTLLAQGDLEARVRSAVTTQLKPLSITAVTGPDSIARYNVIWGALTAGTEVLSGSLDKSAQTDIESRQSKGQINTLLVAYLTSAGPRYVAVWEPAAAGAATRSFPGLFDRQMGQTNQDLKSQGFRPLRAHPYLGPQGGLRWSGVWIQSQDRWFADLNMTHADFLKRRDEMDLKGMTLAFLDILNGRFVGLWTARN